MKRLRKHPTRFVSSFTDLNMAIEVNKYSLYPMRELFGTFAFCDLERRVEKNAELRTSLTPERQG